MADVISITFTESSVEIISGIPRTVTLSTNVPATIFYTLDGTTPTESSSVYTAPITLPTSNPSVTLKVYATNGTDTSAIISEKYGPDISDVKYPRDTVTSTTPSPSQMDMFPFGDNSVTPAVYGGPGGIIVDSPTIDNIPDGYDGNGGRSNGTDKALSNYDFIYSTGQGGRGIGTLTKVTIQVPQPVSPSTSSTLDKAFFNPRAMVIYQDARDTPYDPNIVNLNRGFFSLQRTNVAKNGSPIMNSAFDSNCVTGSFLRSHYNPRDHTMTYYYRDSDTNQWIISKQPYRPSNANIGRYDKIILSSRDKGVGMFFQWIPFLYRRLI